MSEVISLIDKRNEKMREQEIQQLRALLDLFEATGEILPTGFEPFDRKMSTSLRKGRDESEAEKWWKCHEYVMFLVCRLEYLSWPKQTYEQSKRRMLVLERRHQEQQRIMAEFTQGLAQGYVNGQKST